MIAPKTELLRIAQTRFAEQQKDWTVL
jgi:hypothetical protein